jgi:hypothetical protein
VSIANIGQLSVDILLASVGSSSSVGALHHPAVIPCVGSDPFDLGSDELMTACQGNNQGQGMWAY